MRTPDYDPNEPLVVRWEDVIAARNAVGALRGIVQDFGGDERVMLRAGFGLSAGTDRGDPNRLWSQQESEEWLHDLVRRLTQALPGGVPGHEPYPPSGLGD